MCPCVGHGGLSAHFQALSSVLRDIELVIKWCAEHMNGPSTHLTGLEARLPERASDSSLHSAGGSMSGTHCQVTADGAS